MSKILVIGGTGYIGKFIVRAAAASGHPTFALVRRPLAAGYDVDKTQLLEGFKSAGVTLIQGDLDEHESLVGAIKEVDVVISAVGKGPQLADQIKIINAIIEAGNVKRFFPSEFGNDVDRVHAVEPARSAFAAKARIRRAVEAAGIPHTYVSSNFFAGRFLANLVQAGLHSLPTDKITIFGDGNAKAIFVNEEDVATFTIRALDDPRTLNKILYLRPPGNILSQNEIISLLENKTGRTLEGVFVPEQELLKQIREAPAPLNMFLSLCHSAFVKGDHANFEIDPSVGVEATQLYPDVKYRTVDELLNQYL